MIGQLPPFALSTPRFRFRALALRAGRAALGGDREVALACFMVARLGAGTLPPVMLTPGDAASRATSVKHWLSSLALPAPARAAAGATIDAIGAGNRKAAADALMGLAAAAAPQLDNASSMELHDLADEIAGNNAN